MRKAATILPALGFLLVFCGVASAANTISWSPVTSYTDGTPITGKTVFYAIYWSGSSSFASPAVVGSGVTQTSMAFEPSALGMTPGSTVYFAMKTLLSSGEVSDYSAPRSWVVPAGVSTTLNSITIGGPASVNEGSTGSYTATASWSNGSSSNVSASWSVSGASASINSAGTLTAASVSANQTVTVNASYSSGGVTKSASKTVTVVNAAAALTSISIGGPASVNEGATASYTAAASWSDGSSSNVSASWSVSGAYASINSAGTLTAGSVSANQTVTVNASYSSGGVTRTASRSVAIVDTATLESVSIGGPSSVNEGKTGDYILTALWSNGTASIVAANWSVSGAYASINSAGTLTAASVSANQTVAVIASYSNGGVTRSASKNVTVVDEDPTGPATPGDLRIGIPSGSDGTNWRLSWAPVTTYADGQAIGADRSVRYTAYWTRDPYFEAGNLVPLATSVSSRYSDFQPLTQDMTNGEKIYFAVRAILDTGKGSSLSESLQWRVNNKAPAAPKKGRIGFRGAVYQK